jgi:arylsulfatase A-like enzyme
MAASPFAYRQFLAPRVFPSIGIFSDWHAPLSWLWLGMAFASLSDVLRRGGPARLLATGFGAFALLAVAYLTFRPMLPTLADGSRSVVVGLIALVPVFWLALIDYVERWTSATSHVHGPGSAVNCDENRLFFAAVGTALFVATVDAVWTSVAIAGRFEPDLLTRGLTVGLGWNVVDQLLVCCGAFLAVALAQRLIGGLSFGLRYAGLLLSIALLISWVAQRTVYSALGFSGGWLAVVSVVSAASIVLTWGAHRVCRAARGGGAGIESPCELLFGPPIGSAGGVRRVAPFVVLAVTTYGVATVSRIIDWDFLLLKCGVFAVWTAVFDRMFRLPARDIRIRGLAIVLGCLAPLAVYAGFSGPVSAAGAPRHALDRYAIYNPSFRVVDGMLRDATVAGDDSLQAFLRANTGLGSGVGVSPADVSFSPLDAPAPDPPDIFLFVIDSLRRDYLQPYNGSVDFTPNLASFGRDSVVFRRTFSAYGGTGLSVPAIWSGSVGPHKQYVTPFAPMNSLEKLLDRNDYRQYLSFDSVVRQLIPRRPAMTELDAGSRSEDVMFCRTVDELETRLDANHGARQPIFAYSLPQDLHVSNIIGASVAEGELYPGFHAPYAARVRRIDSCFGGFVDFLRRRGWYDRSLIVVTADHGEMLGEEGFWGHVYYLFPPVVEVPLIVHFPTGTARRAPIDVDALSLTTDIAPTIYAVLGYTPRAQTPLMGRSLVGPIDSSLSDRRRDDCVLSASYSAVYAVLRANGTQLYIVDAVQHREYAYERQKDSRWGAGPVTAGLREVSQRVIREHIYTINRIYGVKARH